MFSGRFLTPVIRWQHVTAFLERPEKQIIREEVSGGGDSAQRSLLLDGVSESVYNAGQGNRRRRNAAGDDQAEKLHVFCL